MQHRTFGRLTGLRVSEYALGAGNFGTGWGTGAEPDEARRMFDRFAEAGGTLIDTAESYQLGESETLLGDFLAADRDHFVVATKFSNGAGNARRPDDRQQPQEHGPARSRAACKRLKTDRIDLYWVHFEDGVTPIEEILRGLDDLVVERQDPPRRAVELPRLARSRGRRRSPSCAAGRRSPASRSSTAWSSAPPTASCCRWPRRSGSAWRCGRRSAAGC